MVLSFFAWFCSEHFCLDLFRNSLPVSFNELRETNAYGASLTKRIHYVNNVQPVFRIRR